MRFMLTRWLVWVKGSKFTRRVEQREGALSWSSLNGGVQGGGGAP